MDVHVDAYPFDSVPPVGGAHAEVGHFGAYSREGDEAFYCWGDVGLEMGVEEVGGLF